MLSSKGAFVIGISAVSGGGKTALTLKLAEMLDDAVTIHFDDYDDLDYDDLELTNVHPESLREWFDAGADYDVYKTPGITKHLRSLKSGDSVVSVVDGSTIGPARYVVADAPLGRAHADSGRYIDYMVFIDTAPEVAMARRLLRNLDRAGDEGLDEYLGDLRSDLTSFLNGTPKGYFTFSKQIAETSDLVLNGQLSLDELAQEVLENLGSADRVLL